MILREIYGYGPGIKVDKSTLEALDHYGLMQADETGSSALQTSGGPVVPQQRENYRAMAQIAAEMRASTAVSTKAMARAEKEATVRGLLAAVEPEAVAKTCTECHGVYQREDTFLRHFTNGQSDKKTSTCQGSEDLAIRKEACSRGSERAARRKTIGRATCSFSWSDRCAAL